MLKIGKWYTGKVSLVGNYADFHDTYAEMIA